jgi:hypothetical protein
MAKAKSESENVVISKQWRNQPAAENNMKQQRMAAACMA